MVTQFWRLILQLFMNLLSFPLSPCLTWPRKEKNFDRGSCEMGQSATSDLATLLKKEKSLFFGFQQPNKPNRPEPLLFITVWSWQWQEHTKVNCLKSEIVWGNIGIVSWKTLICEGSRFAARNMQIRLTFPDPFLHQVMCQWLCVISDLWQLEWHVWSEERYNVDSALKAIAWWRSWDTDSIPNSWPKKCQQLSSTMSKQTTLNFTLSEISHVPPHIEQWNADDDDSLFFSEPKRIDKGD